MLLRTVFCFIYYKKTNRIEIKLKLRVRGGGVLIFRTKHLEKIIWKMMKEKQPCTFIIVSKLHTHKSMTFLYKAVKLLNISFECDTVISS